MVAVTSSSSTKAKLVNLGSAYSHPPAPIGLRPGGFLIQMRNPKFEVRKKSEIPRSISGNNFLLTPFRHHSLVDWTLFRPIRAKQFCLLQNSQSGFLLLVW